MTRMVLVLLASAALAFAAEAQSSRCPAWDSGCTWDNLGEQLEQRLHSDTQDYFSDDSTYDKDSVYQRLLNGRKVIHNCFECTTDALSDGLKRLNPGNAVR